MRVCITGLFCNSRSRNLSQWRLNLISMIFYCSFICFGAKQNAIVKSDVSLEFDRFWEVVLRRNVALKMDSVQRYQVLSNKNAKYESYWVKIVPSAMISTSRGPKNSENEKMQWDVLINQWLPGGGAISLTPSWSWMKNVYGSPWPVSRHDTSVLNLAWNQPLLRYAWSGDTVIGQNKIANDDLNISNLEVENKIRSLYLESSVKFWSTFLRSISVLISQADSATSDELLIISRQRMFGGVGTSIDTLQSRAERDRSVVNLIEARMILEKGFEELGELADTSLSLYSDSIFSVKLEKNSKLEAYEPTEPPINMWPTEADWLLAAEKQSLDFQLALANEKRADDYRKIQWWERLPNLVLSSNAKTSLDKNLGSEWQWSSMLSFIWDIPNAANRANYRRANLEYRKQSYARIKVRNLLQKEYRTLLKELKWSEMRIYSKIQLAKTMRKRRDAMHEMYIDGIGQLSDALSAQKDWGKALIDAWNSVVENEILIKKVNW